MGTWGDIAGIFRREATPTVQDMNAHRAALDNATRTYAIVWHALTMEYDGHDRRVGHVFRVDAEGCTFRVEIRQEA